MLDFGDGRICIHEEDMERTELGRDALRSPDARWRWVTWPGITSSEITVGIIAEGPDRARVELKLRGRGTICVSKEDLKRTELGRDLLQRQPGIAWSQIMAWAYSRLPIWDCLRSSDLGQRAR